MSHAGPVRLMLVDDNPAVLRQVAQVLPAGFEIVATLESGERLPSAIAAQHPDVVVLDITLPGQSGIVLAKRIRSSGVATSVVFLTGHCDADYLQSALRAGAIGYVVKARLSLDLEPALRAAVEGDRFISPLPQLRID